MKEIGILAFTERGKELAGKVAAELSGQCSCEIADSRDGAGTFLKENFHKKDTFLFICAAGIAVRMIAPLIRSKDVDPAVIVMDEFGRHAIPVLSGHLGGANQAAAEIAGITGAEVVITTATDLNGVFAVDLWTKKAGCTIVDVKGIRRISSAVLRGEKVGFSCGFPLEGELPKELTAEPAGTGICVSLDDRLSPFEGYTFNVVPRIVTLGAGCRKDSSPEAFEEFVLGVLEQNHVSVHALEKIASIELKKNEKCFLAFSEKYGIPFETYTALQLQEAEGTFESSDFVRSVTGVDNVCERSASIGSGGGRKILSKTSGGGFTCALAVKDWKCRF